MNDRDLLGIPWYPVVDDTIGGYAISNVDKPVSGHDFRKGEVDIGSFLSEDIAKHICDLHNAQLKDGEKFA